MESPDNYRIAARAGDLLHPNRHWLIRDAGVPGQKSFLLLAIAR